MSGDQMRQLREHLKVIHNHFEGLYDPAPGEPFAMEIEFKITSANILAIKQARPWVFGDATSSSSPPPPPPPPPPLAPVSPKVTGVSTTSVALQLKAPTRGRPPGREGNQHHHRGSGPGYGIRGAGAVQRQLRAQRVDVPGAGAYACAAAAAGGTRG